MSAVFGVDGKVKASVVMRLDRKVCRLLKAFAGEQIFYLHDTAKLHQGQNAVISDSKHTFYALMLGSALFN